MSRIIAIFNANKGELHGFKDHRQAQEYLGLDKKELDQLLWQGGGYHNGMFVSELTLHKSSRGGKREYNKDMDYISGLSGSALYWRWKNIKGRCFNPDHAQYHRYGGRGITMCDEWIDDPSAFVQYVSGLENFGKDGYNSIDRIDNNGNYEPGNLRWATAKMQNNNKS